MLQGGKIFEIDFKMSFMMHNGSVINASSETNATNNYYICGEKP